MIDSRVRMLLSIGDDCFWLAFYESAERKRGFKPSLEEANEKLVVGVVCEVEVPHVAVKQIHFHGQTLAELHVGYSFLMFEYLLGCEVFAERPREVSVEEVEQRVKQTLQVVPSAHTCGILIRVQLTEFAHMGYTHKVFIAFNFLGLLDIQVLLLLILVADTEAEVDEVEFDAGVRVIETYQLLPVSYQQVVGLDVAVHVAQRVEVPEKLNLGTGQREKRETYCLDGHICNHRYSVMPAFNKCTT